jgi:hypothetical protein
MCSTYVGVGNAGCDGSLDTLVRWRHARAWQCIRRTWSQKVNISNHTSFLANYSLVTEMSSTGGGWAQLRQQARALETQVRAIVRRRYAVIWLTGDADRITIPLILTIRVNIKRAHKVLGRRAANGIPTARTTRKGRSQSTTTATHRLC